MYNLWALYVDSRLGHNSVRRVRHSCRNIRFAGDDPFTECGVVQYLSRNLLLVCELELPCQRVRLQTALERLHHAPNLHDMEHTFCLWSHLTFCRSIFQCRVKCVLEWDENSQYTGTKIFTNISNMRALTWVSQIWVTQLQSVNSWFIILEPMRSASGKNVCLEKKTPKTDTHESFSVFK